MALSKSPSLTRFLSDFTLGFSDGLTVPFALTAGLSSLGKADTVIYAGLADLCAGSISMGIGGYLSALDELPSPPSTKTRHDMAADINNAPGGGDVEELRGMLRHRASTSDDEDAAREKGDTTAHEQLVLRHLEPLCLPPAAASSVVATLRGLPGGLDRAVGGIEAHNDDLGLAAADAPLPIWPVASGLSIALGYAIGGAIPLLPYFFAATVGLGLRWSIGLCLAALMSFGTGKKWLLGGEDVNWKQCVWSGLQMLALGSIAAAAAVMCVHLLGSVTEAPNV
ncbi:hypothetical protein PWT90_06564 [Aphanocladium album]|nr:hypothetical protein PWT90_06564 [Aphanocladium album]